MQYPCRVSIGFIRCQQRPTSSALSMRLTKSRSVFAREFRARHIEAEIRYVDRLFRLRIRDDGKGIDPRVLQQGERARHWGLPGIRERAKQIGARLDLWSEVGAGTEVELSIPASVAYEKFRDAGGFRIFRKKMGTHA